VDEYQDWSNQLQASRVLTRSRTAPAPHRRVSAEAVSLVRDTRRNPIATRSADEIINREPAYPAIIGQLIDEDKALIPICHPRR
jgi:hypothetical protein